MALATWPRDRLVNRRRSVATWSFRLRPVWRRAPTSGPARSPGVLCGVDVFVAGLKTKWLRQLPLHLDEGGERAPLSSWVSRPARSRPSTWARLQVMSSGASRRSNERLSVNAKSSGDCLLSPSGPARASRRSDYPCARARRYSNRSGTGPAPVTAPGRPGPCLLDQVSMPRPKMRTKPSAS